MAWRLDEAIEHGIIDNTVEGITTGKIWLAGRDEPLILSLNGDCWRDLAGTSLEFENPNPRVLHELSDLDPEQTGTVGDITASLKMRISEIVGDGIHEFSSSLEGPCQWRNIFYLEWFSETNGRVLVEAPSFSLTVSERTWEMDEDLEEAQKLANMSSMRDFMAQVIGRSTNEEGSDESTSMKVRGELDEYEWEERLKESDRLTDAYQEVLEKYMDDPDAEQKEAFVMGWDGLLSAMADREEEGDEDEDDKSETWLFAEEDDEESDQAHPLQSRAHEVALRSFDIVNCAGEAAKEEAAQAFTAKLMQISVKLAGVLNSEGSNYRPEAGFVLAVLKRCLGWTNDAIGSCNELIDKEDDTDQVAALEHLRSDVFEIRDGIIKIRKELKQS
ncbi:MAG: hypothetical protein AB8D78_10475 [Akkermansiaceae bacterium]